MSKTTHKVRVVEARRIKHPIFPEIEKTYLTVRCKDLPDGIRTDANARDPHPNKRVYRDVQKSLMGEDTVPGTFDLMNKGIVILAQSIKKIDDETYEITVNEGQGIVDGGHTYRIIVDAQGDPELPDEQLVEVQIRTGVGADLITDISRGLNTGMQVKKHTIDNLDGKYEWMKEELAEESYFERFSWRENDPGDYDVRDLICLLEALNIFDFPNDQMIHPVQAYEKWSGPAEKFGKDFDEHKDDINQSTYHRLRPLLKDALYLHDLIRHDFRDIYNKADLGNAGALKIVEERKGNRLFEFPFAGYSGTKYRLAKGAFYPIFGAFRNKVEIDPATGSACWKGGFPSVLNLWRSIGGELAAQTKHATATFGSNPDMIGKARPHWVTLHQTVELNLLRSSLRERDEEDAA